MRWDNLFDDLEGQLEHELNLEEGDLRAEEERLRLGRMSLRDRIRSVHESEPPHAAYSLKLLLADGSAIAVRPVTIGKDWLSADLVDDTARRSQLIIPLASIGGISLTRAQVAQSLTPSAESEGGPGLSARLTLSFVIRDLCRRRSSVQLRHLEGTLAGTIDRVGRDHLDLAVHERGSARRESVVSEYRVVPFSQLLHIRV